MRDATAHGDQHRPVASGEAAVAVAVATAATVEAKVALYSAAAISPSAATASKR